MIDSAVKILVEKTDADSVRGVVPAGQNPYKMWRFNGYDKPLQPLLAVEGVTESYNAPRQILPQTFWQTGHIDAIRTTTITRKNSLTGDVVYPLVIDPRYTVDIDTLSDWEKYETLVYQGGLDMVRPDSGRRRSMPEKIELVLLDFDGVITDNRVWTDQDGRETVAAYRSDSILINDLREKGIDVMILSSEVNTVVAARAKKMGVEAIHGEPPALVPAAPSCRWHGQPPPGRADRLITTPPPSLAQGSEEEVPMAAQRTSFEKLQRDRAKKAKQAAKREKRLEKGNEEETEELTPLAPAEPGTELSAGELLARVEEIHRLFDDKKISFEDFEEQKADLMARISVD
jgi:hypothetical protein